MDLKRIIASSCRQKMLKALSKSKEVRVMKLVSETNSAYNEVNRNLKILETESLVTNNRLGRMRLIKLNRENQRTKILLQVLKTLEGEDDE